MTVGIDLTSTTDWERRLKHTPAVSDVAFSLPERWWCERSPARHALVWAIKEAMVKLLGTGFGPVGWQDITVRPSLVSPGSLSHVLQVTLGPTAQQTCRNIPLPQPLRCQIRHDGDHLLVVMAAGLGRVAVEEQTLTPNSPLLAVGNLDRAGQVTAVSQARRTAAREAGRRAVARLAGGPVHWTTPRNARPSVRWPCGATSAASFTHVGNLAYAAVHDTRLTNLQTNAPFPLIFHHDQDLFAGMRTTRRWTDISSTSEPWFAQPQLHTELRPSA